MSHIVEIKVEVRDETAIAAACRRLGLGMAKSGTAKLFSGEKSGLLLQLPGWQYPAVIDTAAGTVAYDHFEGRWGDPVHLDRFLQAYAVERAKLEARKRNPPVTESVLEDGSIRLQIHERAWVASPASVPSPSSRLQPERNSMNRVIEVTVSPKGEVTVQTRGYAGETCLKAAESLRDGLGAVLSDRPTAEFYQAPVEAEQRLRQ